MPEHSKDRKEASDTTQALQLLLRDPIRFTYTVAGFLVVILLLLWVAAYATIRLIKHEQVEVNGIRFHEVTQQITVPAYAGWVAINPTDEFPENSKFEISVSGRIHIALQHAMNLTNFAGRYGDVPKFDTCEKGREYLDLIGHWKYEWADFYHFAAPASSTTHECLLNPNGEVGQLVYAVVRSNPRKYTGVQGLVEGPLVHLGAFSPMQLELDTEKYGGFVLMAINDSLINDKCDSDGLRVKTEHLRSLLKEMDSHPECGSDAGRYQDKYVLDSANLTSRFYADNAGEFLVHLTQK